MYSTQEIH